MFSLSIFTLFIFVVGFISGLLFKSYFAIIKKDNLPDYLDKKVAQVQEKRAVKKSQREARVISPAKTKEMEDFNKDFES